MDAITSIVVKILNLFITNNLCAREFKLSLLMTLREILLKTRCDSTLVNIIQNT